jgi:hypothetical protein
MQYVAEINQLISLFKSEARENDSRTFKEFCGKGWMDANDRVLSQYRIYKSIVILGYVDTLRNKLLLR